MDQSSRNSESSPFKLPEVQPEPIDNTPGFETGNNAIEEKAKSKAIEQNDNAGAFNGLNAPASVPLTVDPSIVTDQGSPIQSAKKTSKKIIVTDNIPANDVDLIEKAWVIKAKAIVDQTRNDPYEQSNEINKIREDYQSKRFNTKIKIDKE